MLPICKCKLRSGRKFMAHFLYRLRNRAEKQKWKPLHKNNNNKANEFAVGMLSGRS